MTAIKKQQQTAKVKTFVLQNISVVNSRLVTPVHRSFVSQYTLLASGHNLGQVSKSAPNADGSFWINSNATFPNGDAVPPVETVTRTLKPFINNGLELGEGSLVDLLFNVVNVKDKIFYNLRTVRVLDYVAPFDHLSAFKTADDANANLADDAKAARAEKAKAARAAKAAKKLGEEIPF